MKTPYTIEASNPSTTSTRTEGGVDVDVEITLYADTAKEMCVTGEVTLLRDGYSGKFGSWGNVDHWLDGATHQALLDCARRDEDLDLSELLDEIASEAGHVADKAVDSGEVEPWTEG